MARGAPGVCAVRSRRERESAAVAAYRKTPAAPKPSQAALLAAAKRRLTLGQKYARRIARRSPLKGLRILVVKHVEFDVALTALILGQDVPRAIHDLRRLRAKREREKAKEKKP